MSKESAMNLINQAQVEPMSIESLPIKGSEAVENVDNPQAKESEPSQSVNSEKFARLAKKELILQKERNAIREEREKIKDIQKKIEEFEKKKKESPIEALKEIGFSDTDLMNALSGEEKKPLTTEEVTKKIVEEEISNFKKQEEEARAKVKEEENQKIVNDYKKSIGDFINTQKEEFKFCAYNGEGASELIFETVLGLMEQNQNLSHVDALKIASQAVEDDYNQEFLELMKLKKVEQKKEEIKEDKEKINKTSLESVQKYVQERKKIPTIKNDKSINSNALAKETVKKESPEEKRARLENMLRMMGKS